MKIGFAKVSLVIAILIPVVVFAYVSPGKPSGLVNDFAGILSVEQKATLEATLAQNEQSTGNEISVVIIKNLNGDTVENYATSLFKEWGIGKKGKDNGALLLVAIDERQMRVEVGYGLEPVLTDAQSGRIIRNVITPKFKQGDYYGGISDGVTQIITATKGEAISASAGETAPPWWANIKVDFLIFWFGFVFIQWLVSVMARSRSWWLGGVMGAVIGLVAIFFTTILAGIIVGAILTPLGLLFDFLISREYGKSKIAGKKPSWWAGGGPWIGGGGLSGGGFGGRGGFGGFGGGFSGGGGASGRW